MREETWKRLEAKFARFPDAGLVAGPAPADEVDGASAELGLPFPPDYREFLLRYGGAIAGPYPVYGVHRAEAMGIGETVVEQNRRYRAQGWPGVEDWLIISSDHAGNPWGIAPDGQVWIADHDFGDIKPIARDFEDFVNRKCLGIVEEE